MHKVQTECDLCWGQDVVEFVFTGTHWFNFLNPDTNLKLSWSLTETSTLFLPVWILIWHWSSFYNLYSLTLSHPNISQATWTFFGYFGLKRSRDHFIYLFISSFFLHFSLINMLIQSLHAKNFFVFKLSKTQNTERTQKYYLTFGQTLCFIVWF